MCADYVTGVGTKVALKACYLNDCKHITSVNRAKPGAKTRCEASMERACFAVDSASVGGLASNRMLINLLEIIAEENTFPARRGNSDKAGAPRERTRRAMCRVSGIWVRSGRG